MYLFIRCRVHAFSSPAAMMSPDVVDLRGAGYFPTISACLVVWVTKTTHNGEVILRVPVSWWSLQVAHTSQGCTMHV